MDVAVTGSTGLIGEALCASLTADGHTVRRVRRGSSASAGDVAWDLDERTIDAAALEGVDGVVHLAGEPIAARRWTDAQRRRIHDSRTTGTALLAEALAGLERKPSVLVSASAIGYYGERGDDVVTEDDPPADGFLGRVCQDWEAAALPASEAGIRVAHPRTGIVLTPRGGALAKMLPLFKIGLGGRFGSGRQWMSWISLTDEVRALRFLLDHDVAGPANLTAPEPVRNAELASTLGEVLGRPSLVPVPEFGPKLLLGGELADELLFNSARIVPRTLLDAGFEFSHPTLGDGLRAELGRS
ncbi:MAG: TIGR01777 family oxidoreductase [Actinomycetota bacterium]|nr:TIGR01777 family oxidoreductase [Actinomycetota bacterium]